MRYAALTTVLFVVVMLALDWWSERDVAPAATHIVRAAIYFPIMVIGFRISAMWARRET